MRKPLRIAFFVHEFPALSETFVLNQASGLVEQGHDVTIFAERPRDEPRIHPDVSRYGLIGRTRYLGMPRRKIARLLCAGRPLLHLVRSRPSTAMGALSVPRFGRDAWSLRLLYWSERLMDEGPFDVIHCHFGPIGQLAAKLRDIRAFAGLLGTVFHGVDISAYVRGRPDYYQYLFTRGDLFLPISEKWRRRLEGIGCNPARIVVHHMGVEFAPLSLSAKTVRARQGTPATDRGPNGGQEGRGVRTQGRGHAEPPWRAHSIRVGGRR